VQIWIFVELIFVYFFYIETRGPTLEEVAKIFDGESATVAHVDLHQVEKEIVLDKSNEGRARRRRSSMFDIGILLP